MMINGPAKLTKFDDPRTVVAQTNGALLRKCIFDGVANNHSVVLDSHDPNQFVQNSS